MTGNKKPRPLYPEILDGAWHRLAEPVRAAHAPGVERQGRFRVTHGGGRFARRLLRLSGLPREAEDTDVTLTIHADPESGGERWERRFGRKTLTTTQWESGGRLCERLGFWELRFTLTENGGSLDYRQCRAALRLGSLRVPVPSALAPRVEARETAGGPDRVRVRVSVRLPWPGVFVCYEGFLHIPPPSVL